jgi:hypothetical protein
LIGRSCRITGLEVLKDCGLSVGALGNKAASELFLTRCVYPKEAFFIAIPVEFSEGASENSVDVKDDSRCLAAGKLIRRNHQFRNGLNQSGLRNGEEFATRSQRVGNRSTQHGQGSHGHRSGCRHGLQEISSMHRVGHSRPPKRWNTRSDRRLKVGLRNWPEPTHVYHKVRSGAAEFSAKAQTTEIHAARSSRFARAGYLPGARRPESASIPTPSLTA